MFEDLPFELKSRVSKPLVLSRHPEEAVEYYRDRLAEIPISVTEVRRVMTPQSVVLAFRRTTIEGNKALTVSRLTLDISNHDWLIIIDRATVEITPTDVTVYPSEFKMYGTPDDMIDSRIDAITLRNVLNRRESLTSLQRDRIYNRYLADTVEMLSDQPAFLHTYLGFHSRFLGHELQLPLLEEGEYSHSDFTEFEMRQSLTDNDAYRSVKFSVISQGLRVLVTGYTRSLMYPVNWILVNPLTSLSSELKFSPTTDSSGASLHQSDIDIESFEQFTRKTVEDVLPLPGASRRYLAIAAMILGLDRNRPDLEQAVMDRLT